MAKRFSKCPSWWLRDETILRFQGGKSAGHSIAALKCVMAISTKIDFWTRKVKLSFSDLETLTGLSRPMVSKGIAFLGELDIISIDRAGYVNEYELNELENDKGWAKLPSGLISRHLPELSNRGSVPLAALKIYMQLLALRPNDNIYLSIKHEKLRDLTGVQKTQIRPALDILFSHALIRITQGENQKDTRSHNIYTLMGLEL